MDKTKIEWADSTWNPVTGCLHGCEYCYAKKIVKRFDGCYDPNSGENIKQDLNGIFCLENTGSVKYKTKRGKIINAPFPYGFAPTLHRFRLEQLAKTKKSKTIFVGSMCDLFGDWIPEKWIAEVFEACQEAPQHRYLFLTKNPSRYADLNRKGILPNADNFWFGATFDHSNWSSKKAGHDPGDFYFPNIYRANTFVSFEPLTIDFNIGSVKAKWIIIGAETGNRKRKIIPKREWVEQIVSYSRSVGIPVFMKNSLHGLMGDDFVQEFPW